MEKVDARGQSREALQQRRAQVLQLYEQGVPVMQIVARSGLSWSAVNSAIKRHNADGAPASMPEKRGRKQGSGRALSVQQETDLRQFIRARRPWFYKLGDYLWNHDAVLRLVELKCGLRLSERAVSHYLSRWGLTLKSPEKRGADRCSAEVQNWLREHFAEIEHMARVDDAEIYWLQRPVSIDAKLWCRDMSPESSDNGMPGSAFRKRSMVTAVSNRGKVSWAIIDRSFGPDRQIRFIDALLKDSAKKKAILIRSDQNMYRGLQLIDWINWNTNRVRIFPSFD